MNFEVFKEIENDLKELILTSEVKHEILELQISHKKLLSVVHLLKEKFAFDLFLDVTAVDHPERKPERFTVVYHFYSTTHFVRVRIKANVTDENPHIDTLTTLYGSAHYMERECHDMYGIKFIGNNDLRPILLYNGFVGHPLRKDYPIDKEQPLVPYIK